jgi:hypothetical protein
MRYFIHSTFLPLQSERKYFILKFDFKNLVTELRIYYFPFSLFLLFKKQSQFPTVFSAEES